MASTEAIRRRLAQSGWWIFGISASTDACSSPTKPHSSQPSTKSTRARSQPACSVWLRISHSPDVLLRAFWRGCSPDFPPETLFRSSVALENLLRIEAMLRGPDPFGRNPKGFGGLASPKWPSHLFPDDPAWKIKPERLARGRELYAVICAECHLGPVADPAFDTQFPDKSFWSVNSKNWKQSE